MSEVDLLIKRLYMALQKRSDLLDERRSLILQDEMLQAHSADLLKANRRLFAENTLLGIIHSCETGQ